MKTLLIFFSVLLSFPVIAQKDLEALLKTYNMGSIPYLSVEETRMQQLTDSSVILDAREPEEFSISHIKTAINVVGSQ